MIDPHASIMSLGDLMAGRSTEPVEYHRGFLAVDRVRFASNPKPENASAVDDAGGAAWRGYLQGRLVLYQRRHGAGDYSYWAERRKSIK